VIKLLICGKNVLKETPINKIHKVYIKENFKDNTVLTYIKENKIRYEIVPEFRLNKMTKERHQGIILDVDDYEYYKLEDAYQDDFVVLLDHLEDPHNLGAIIRTCECAGIKSIIIPKERSVRVNDTVMKTSAGAINNVKIILVSNLNDALKKLQKNLFFVYAADMDGKDYREVDYASKKVLVIGAEGDGVSRIIRESSDEIISIPMYGQINSLNASVSAAILIYGMNRGKNGI
jgi:23S rRNA (guanosine2251-2'-O)-methyltransferase